VTGLLVLWDVDYTLVDAAASGRRLYEIAFGQMFGVALPIPSSMAGRTDRAIALEVLTLAGVAQPRQQVAAFEALLAQHAPAVGELIRTRGRPLPGAVAALAALAALDPSRSGLVVQSVLTGNIRELAEVKLGELGLTRYLDLTVGAYGNVSAVRADLVQVARSSAAARYGTDFGAAATVLIGDTPSDVEAALSTGARAVAVASGSFSPAELTAAGAHAVLPDLRDTGRVLAAILGSPSPP
jgi:phosphoglycolate phosphatase